MRALITGAGGQLGRSLATTAPAGIEIIAMTHAALDIADDAAVAAVLAAQRPDILVNAAAYTDVDRAEAEPELAMRVNRDGPGVLARAAANARMSLVHISSDFVFDGQLARPYPPHHPTAPLNLYGRSKADGEAAVRNGLPAALIIRTAWLYAPQGGNFVLRLIELMRQSADIRVVADQIGTPTHSGSLASAVWALIAAGATGTHHYTDAGVASWYDLAVAVGEEALAAGLIDHAPSIVPVHTGDYPTAAKRPSYAVLDKTETYALLGGPSVHWRVELRRMLRAMAAPADD